MANVYPDRVKAGTSDAERALHTALRRLSDMWTVFHSVAWQGDRAGKPADGEADFVLLHPRHGLVVIEVKGGGIHYEGLRWYSLNPHGRYEIKDPFQQATDSKHALLRYLRGAGLPYLAAGHAVAFPDASRTGGLGPSAPPEIIVDKSDLKEVERAVERITTHWRMAAALSDHQVVQITALLAPTTIVRALLRDELTDVGARMLYLTQQQFTYLDLLRRQRRALIIGGAGTGKTVLAAERARRLAAEGFSVVLTCYNRPLGRYLANEFDANPQVTVYSFHQLVFWQAKRAGLDVPQDPDQHWWDDVSAEYLVEAATQNRLTFDALVVDEGQDFPPQWFAALQMLLNEPDTAPFYVFADSHQAIYRSDWEPPFSGEPYELTVNCRNTIPIHGVVARVFQDSSSNQGVSGPEPTWKPVQSPEEVLKAVENQLHRLMNEGQLNAKQVAVLTQSRLFADELRAKKRAGLVLTDLDGQGPVCETIHRFKGLESEAVILILDELADDRDRQLAYIGLSRARSVLVVIGPVAVLDQLH